MSQLCCNYHIYINELFIVIFTTYIIWYFRSFNILYFTNLNSDLRGSLKSQLNLQQPTTSLILIQSYRSKSFGVSKPAA